MAAIFQNCRHFFLIYKKLKFQTFYEPDSDGQYYIRKEEECSSDIYNTPATMGGAKAWAAWAMAPPIIGQRGPRGPWLHQYFAE